MILPLVAQFEEVKSVGDTSSAGREKTASSIENSQGVQEVVHETPTTCRLRRSLQLCGFANQQNSRYWGYSRIPKETLNFS